MRGKKKRQILMVGGDQRDLYLLKALIGNENTVSAFALPKSLLPTGTVYCKKLEKFLPKADVVILPMPGVRDDGKLYAPLAKETIYIPEEQWQLLKENAIVLVGVACPKLKQLAAQYHWHLQETAELDAIAIPNAIPTAEGAIKIAIEETPFTLDGADIVVLGYGRVGEVLAKKMKALDGKITVLNRGKERQETAKTDGFSVPLWEQLAETVAKGDIVYNTIPSLILTEDILAKMKHSAVIIDLATKPGGTDFDAAQKQGIKAMLAPGLPGKVAPQFAGELLGKVYPALISQLEKEIALTQEEIAQKVAVLEEKNAKADKKENKKDDKKAAATKEETKKAKKEKRKNPKEKPVKNKRKA